MGGMPFAGIPGRRDEGQRLPGRPWAPFLGKAPCPLEPLAELMRAILKGDR